MKSRGIIRWSILLALVLTALSTSYAFGCLPDDDNPARCLRLPKATPQDPSATLDSAATNLPGGINLENAITPNGRWQHINPGSSLWYKMNDARLQLEIWIDTNGQSGLSLEIYAPDQHDSYGKPIGRGSFSKFQPHDLFWTGRSAATGVWYAVVTNASPAPISYSLNYKRARHKASDRCSECHGDNIEWDRCQDGANSTFCEDLQNEYNSGNP
ncbi:MAG: hypothetical protein KGJ80_15025 [Chloroflexota bacterium]|nr:hypothetical protein [Chloroflexota bacterium]